MALNPESDPYWKVEEPVKKLKIIKKVEKIEKIEKVEKVEEEKLSIPLDSTTIGTEVKSDSREGGHRRDLKNRKYRVARDPNSLYKSKSHRELEHQDRSK